jgi:hypothetical protein
VRLACLHAFDRLLQSPQREAAAEGQLVAILTQSFAPHQSDEAERRLMEKIELSLAWLRTLRGASRQAITEVLERIIAGQQLDRTPIGGQDAIGAELVAHRVGPRRPRAFQQAVCQCRRSSAPRSTGHATTWGVAGTIS